jgi:ATP-dependent protease ClpP protease subunit
MKKKIFNFGWGDITVQWNEADSAEPSQMLCYDAIGKDPWSDRGISASDFQKGINELPTDRDLVIKVNSKGGDVHEGNTMRSNLMEWKNRTGRKVITVIDGIAASTASWFSVTVSDEVRAYKSSQMFLHDAMCLAYGNAEQFEKAVSNLKKTSDQIAQMYSEKSGKSKKAMRQLMTDETLLTGEEAADIGLVDTIIDGKAIKNFTPRELSNMTNQLGQLASVYNSVAQSAAAKANKQTNNMNKKKMIAVLKKHGITNWEGSPISEETSEESLVAALETVENTVLTDAQLEAKYVEIQNKKKTLEQKDSSAATVTEIANLRAEMASLKEFANTQRELAYGKELDQLIVDDKLTIAERPAALKRLVNDATYLNELRARPTNGLVGGSPLKPAIELVGNSFTEVQSYLLTNGPKFMRNFIGNRAGDHGEGYLGRKVCEDIRDRAIIVANTITKHKDMLVSMFNTNTIDAGLQRQIILQEMLEEFAVVLKVLQQFSFVASNVPLEGTDEVDVPFYPLATDAGTSWDPATGYAGGFGNTTTNTRPVVVGGSGVTSGSSAPANTAKDRKWVGAQFSSYELARQPYLNVQKLMIQKANRLGVLIFQDIVSRVITAGNFGASVKGVAAAQFSADDIADLWENATGRNWPDRGRSLCLDHTYKTPLLKDVSFKQYLAAGTTETLRKANIQEAYGFEDIPIVPNLTSYSPAGENLVGWINWMYAVLVATAPIMPTPEVRALMTRYDVVVHPTIGIAFEYRRFGDTTLDQTKEVIECSYGAAKGVASALARITSS